MKRDGNTLHAAFIDQYFTLKRGPNRESHTVTWNIWTARGQRGKPCNVNPGLINHGLLIRGAFPQ